MKKIELKNELSFTPKVGEIKIGKFTVLYDIEDLIKTIEKLEWDSENYEYDCSVNGHDAFSMNEKEFNLAKENFIKEVRNLPYNIVDLFNSNVVITKAGVLSKARKQVILQSDIIHEYYYHDGRSHEYYSPYIKAVQLDVTTIRLDFNNGVSSQSL